MSKKGIFGIIFGGAVVGTTIIVTRKIVQKKYQTIRDVDVDEEKKEDESVLKKIKEFVVEKVKKIIEFCVNHMEEIQAVSAAVGLVAGLFEIGYHVKKTKNIDKISKQLDRIEHVNTDSVSWKEGFDSCNATFFDEFIAKSGKPDTINFRMDDGTLRKFNIVEVIA